MHTIAVAGKVPDDLTWEIGVRPGGGPPLLRFHGEMRLDLAPACAAPAGPTGAQ
jgi:hypothetical protein